MKDLIIIGGSAAATATGIYAARRNLDFKIITKDIGGEVATSGEIGNYPGFSEGILAHRGKTNGFELAKAFRKHLEFYNVEIEEGVEVKEIKNQKLKIKSQGIALFKIGAEKNGNNIEYETKTVIVATGTYPRHLGVPGEKEFYLKGVSYCTTCDGPLFKDKIVAVIGGGNSAMEAAIMLFSGIAKKVYIVNINSELKGEGTLIEKLQKADNVEIISNAATTEIIGNGIVKALKYENTASKEKKRLDLGGIFVHIGMMPNSDFIKNVEKNKFNEIIVNQKCETNIPGLFAAGDVTNIPYKQVVIAAGQGAIAALSATEYLNKLVR